MYEADIVLQCNTFQRQDLQGHRRRAKARLQCNSKEGHHRRKEYKDRRRSNHSMGRLQGRSMVDRLRGPDL